MSYVSYHNSNDNSLPAFPWRISLLFLYFDHDLSLCTVPLETWLFSTLCNWLFLLGWGSSSCFLSTYFVAFFKFFFLFLLCFSFYCSLLDVDNSHLTMFNLLFFCIQKCSLATCSPSSFAPLPKYLSCTGRDFYTSWTCPLWPLHIPLISLICLSPPLVEASLHRRCLAQHTSLLVLKEGSLNECI